MHHKLPMRLYTYVHHMHIYSPEGRPRGTPWCDVFTHLLDVKYHIFGMTSKLETYSNM